MTAANNGSSTPWRAGTAVHLPPALALGPVVALALALRVTGIGVPNLWLDEADSWEVARYPLGKLFSHLQESPAGPLYFILLKGCMALFGDSESALRLLSLAASLALLPVTYAIGVRLLSPGAALFGTLLLALSPVQLYFAQEARMYMLLSLLSACCVLACIKWHSAEERPGSTFMFDPGRGTEPLVLYVLFATLALYTHYAAALLLLALNLDALIRFSRHPDVGIRRRRVTLWIAAQAAIALLLLPFLAGLDVAAARGSQAWRPPLGYCGAVQGLFLFFLQSVHGVVHYPALRVADLWRAEDYPALAQGFLKLLVIYPLIFMALVAAFANRPRARAAAAAATQSSLAGWLSPPTRFLYLCLAVPLALATLVAIGQSLQFTRYLLFVSPFLFLLVGAGLAGMAGVKRAVAFAVLLGGMTVGIAQYWKVPDRDSNYRPVARVLAGSVAEQERVFLHPAEVDPTLTYYLRDTSIRHIGLERGDPLAQRLAGEGGIRNWVVIDYRSPLYDASPANLRSAVGARPILERRYAREDHPGVRVLLVQSGQD